MSLGVDSSNPEFDAVDDAEVGLTWPAEAT